jgi:hypothetical protein
MNIAIIIGAFVVMALFMAMMFGAKTPPSKQGRGTLGGSIDPKGNGKNKFKN